MTATPSTAAPSTLRPRLATTALFLANGFGIGVWAASVAPVKLALGLDDAELGLALLAFAAGAMVTMPVTGQLASRFGSTRVSVCAGLFFAAALALPPLAPGLLTLSLAIFALGLGSGAMDVAMNSHGTLVERARGRPIMSSLHAAYSLGCLLGAAAGGWILSFGYDARATLATASAAGFILVLAAAANLKVAGSSAATGPDRPAGFVLPNRAVLLLGALAFLTFFAEGAIADWSAVYLVAAAGATTAQGAAGFGGFACAMTVCRLVGDRVVLRFGGLRVVILGAMLAALGLAMPLVLPEVALAVVGYALAGIGLANIVPVLFSNAGRRIPAHPGIGVGMASTCGYAGLLLGPPLIGFVSRASGLAIALTLPVVAALIVALTARKALGHNDENDGHQMDRAGPRR